MADDIHIKAIEADCDLLIVGAGGAGLMAALVAAKSGATVIVLEKGAKLGGTTAVSGGIIWAPCNDHMAGDDDREAALAYFNSLDHGDLRSETIAAFVDTAAEALRFIEAHSRVTLTPLEAYPDYFGDRPGARVQGGRALDSGLFSYNLLGDWKDRVLTAAIYPLALAETPLGGGTGQIDPAILADRIADDVRGFGQALIAGLLDACLEAGVSILLDHPVRELIASEGRICGVLIDDKAGPKRLHSRRGLIVTTGGFEWNKDLAQSFLRGPISHPASPPHNMGDGLKMLMAAGAALGNMTSAWWCPTILTGEQWDDGQPRAQPVLIERTLPGSMIVNGDGKRFCNEAANYSALAGAFHSFDPNRYAYLNQPAWLIFDHDYKMKWPVGGCAAGEGIAPWMISADTLAKLAENLGISAEALEQTVTRFNADADTGHDRDFERGEARYDRFYGDQTRSGASATLGSLNSAPYYAVPLHLGVLGTNGGARTDGAARVLGHDGRAIPGLFAAGNVIACPTGGIYAGAGGTLGPTLTFAYLAANSALREEV